MPKYMKKPIVIEAEVYREGLEDGFTLETYMPDGVELTNLESFLMKDVSTTFTDIRKLYPYIRTLEGKHYIGKGDYIITGVKGERYPCKPDIFHMTYEEIDESRQFIL